MGLVGKSEAGNVTVGYSGTSGGSLVLGGEYISVSAGKGQLSAEMCGFEIFSVTYAS